MDRGCVHVGSLRCGRGHGARVTGAAEGGETARPNPGACAPGVGGRCEGPGRVAGLWPLAMGPEPQFLCSCPAGARGLAAFGNRWV
jgi:hypothetical protein